VLPKIGQLIARIMPEADKVDINANHHTPATQQHKNKLVPSCAAVNNLNMEHMQVLDQG